MLTFLKECLIFIQECFALSRFFEFDCFAIKICPAILAIKYVL